MTYGSFIYGGESIGGDVYGPGDIATIISTDQLTGNLIRLNLDSPVVVNAGYLNPDNYTATVVAGTGDIRIRRVLQPKKLPISTDIILETDHITEGTTYSIDVTDSIVSTSNRAIDGTGEFTGKRVKGMSILKSVPSHYNTGPDSLLLHVLLAISLSDTEIGGQ